MFNFKIKQGDNFNNTGLIDNVLGFKIAFAVKDRNRDLKSIRK